jgi:transposase
MSYDIRFRCHVLKIRDQEGLSFSRVAERFGLSKQSVYNWSKRLEEQKKRFKPATKIDMATLSEDIRQYPDGYQYARAARLGVSRQGIWHALRRLKVTYKKTPQAPQGRPRKTFCILPKT